MTAQRDARAGNGRSRIWMFAIAGAVLLAVAPVRQAEARTITVPGDQPTVRTAVSAAAHGDTVLVAPGIYSGGMWINGRAVTIASWYVVSGDTGVVARTIVSGVVAGACGGDPSCSGNAVFEFGDNANGSAVIGLTVTGGDNGIASASTVDITRCRVVGNGDGVDYVPGAGGTLRNSLFANNLDDGIDLNGRMNVTILDSDIRDNADDGIEYRLYAYAGPTKQVNIIGNRITGNREDGVQLIDYPGHGNYVIRMERNLFQANFDSAGSSAAVGCMPGAETVESLIGAPLAERIYVTNNTFIGEANGVVGGANTMVLNNIFTDTQGAALSRVGGNSIASYNLFWNNGAHYVESNIDVSQLLYAPPLLNAAGGPTPASPAIDAGATFFQWQGETVLNLPPSAYGGSAPDLGAFETAANAAPVISAGTDLTVTLVPDAVELSRPDVLGLEAATTLRADARLEAMITDDGLPYPPRSTTIWSLVSGPGPVTLSNPLMSAVQATFFAPGLYLFQLDVSDGLLAASDVVEVTVLPAVNQPPVVDAGPPQMVTLIAGAPLDGTVIDDGLPDPPGDVTIRWTVGSGPGTVTFEGADLADAWARFSTPGTYVLRLSADDGAHSVSDTVVITVLAVRNRAPLVDAGTSQTVTLPASATLDGTVSDDGLPSPPAAVTTTWSAVSGPGPVTFEDANQVDTEASFIVAGIYVLQLLASDGALSAADQVQITVLPPPGASGAASTWAASPGPAVRVAPGLEFALRAPSPQPARGTLRIEFTLADAGPATLDLIDVAGRRVVARELGPLGPGRHAIELREGLSAGLYLVRLRQGGRALIRKVLVVH